MSKLYEYDYHALDDGIFEHGWRSSEVEEFDYLYNEGYSLWDIARYFKRDPDEVAVLMMDRIRRGKIQKRETGAFGRKLSNERGRAG